MSLLFTPLLFLILFSSTSLVSFPKAAGFKTHPPSNLSYPHAIRGPKREICCIRAGGKIAFSLVIKDMLTHCLKDATVLLQDFCKLILTQAINIEPRDLLYRGVGIAHLSDPGIQIYVGYFWSNRPRHVSHRPNLTYTCLKCNAP